MSSIEALVNLASFRSAFNVLFAMDRDVVRSIKRELGGAVAREASDETEADPASRRVLEILFQAATREGVEDVLEDVKSGFPDLADGELAFIGEILQPVPEYTERLEGMRQRDGFLPIVNSAKFALDLRFIETESGQKLVPVVTARLHFDESIGGSESLVAQIPIPLLRALATQLDGLAETIESLENEVSSYEIPDWAKETSDGY